MSKLANKVAIVTGAGSGIGRATAILFAEQGAKIVVADWTTETGQETARMIEEAGGDAIFIKTDVSKSADVEKMVKAGVDEFGQIDILINNAGIDRYGNVEATDEETWDQTIAVNLKSVYLCSKSALPEMKKVGKGKIVNIASIAGLVGFNELAAYCASKGGVINLTRQMALDYAPQNININAIAPGVIETAMTKELLDDPAQAKPLKDSTPYPRFGIPNDIAQSILYLASDDSDFVNGETITVDGGWCAK